MNLPLQQSANDTPDPHGITLASSTRALGPNTYLRGRDFLLMLAAALLVHVCVVTLLAVWPNEEISRIPVRALSFKIGDVDRLRAMPAPPPLPPPPINSQWVAPPDTSALPVPAPLKAASLPRPAPLQHPPSEPAAIAGRPQQYVREAGAAPKAAEAAQAQETSLIRARYEQEISSWIQRHKIYPPQAAGREGRAVVRVRIDRAGYVRYFAIEQSSGLGVLDEAALDMIRRANPLPAVPEGYPSSQLVEFLIPITFKAPV
jgi:TonB family protein